MTGVGDGAYFWAPHLIYVRLADRGSSIRMSAAESGDRALRAALLKLAVEPSATIGGCDGNQWKSGVADPA